MLSEVTTNRDLEIPAHLRWYPWIVEHLDKGSLVQVLKERPGNQVEILTLAGPMVVGADCLDGWKRKQD